MEHLKRWEGSTQAVVGWGCRAAAEALAWARNDYYYSERLTCRGVLLLKGEAVVVTLGKPPPESFTYLHMDKEETCEVLLTPISDWEKNGAPVYREIPNTRKPIFAEEQVVG